ncbi:hypothetical protein BDA96_04G137800 [Sorghum bicolor]|uniref:Uncharacterized protein n=2 Tax=Sorghum bicolor TaxID=4558 RepID=C5Y070_SORBI|nr:uncharacterized protein LOC8077749 [Sorghum bicolor]XP_021316220.1 uncharacterized protein LOC8077749 [Sorghum bicolor]EES04945.1 hypothetical protein SORBI_3004G129500 [Sorghum bicolor]KAG0532794.1 hypothetical protein BDA96_04G137800 [Sorghum bicolor]OQU84824.1 hypothetical protein SORBI_3004G129500 [Sorghum bicolor]|eukprot:XP_002451969.1 uncharacterized protein LOC8077749 [Sorghum bicolor]
MEEMRDMAQSTLAVASAAVISLVLGDDNLLGEILLRLGFATDLVRAAAVCRRWLRAASDPVFLRRFRDLHPPRLHGFYIDSYPNPTLKRRFYAEFVPMQPQPPELAAVLRRGRFSLDTYDSQSTRVLDCRNGRVIVSLFCGGDFKRGVHSPLHPARDLVIFPQLPKKDVPDSDSYSSKIRIFYEILSKESVDGLSYFAVSLDYCVNEEKATTCVYRLQDNAWRMQTSATTQISGLQGSSLKQLSIFLAEDKIYMGITMHNILVLDLTSSTFSTIKFPDKMSFDGQIILSRANGAGIYLSHVKDLQLCIWLHMDCNGSIGDWLLVDTISLHDLCANLKISNSSTTEDGDDPDNGDDLDAYVHMVGGNAEYVFLEMDRYILYLDVRSRALHKVHTVTEKNTLISFIHPFMMTWPPVFPALQE